MTENVERELVFLLNSEEKAAKSVKVFCHFKEFLENSSAEQTKMIQK
jgi:hypothetical protein